MILAHSRDRGAPVLEAELERCFRERGLGLAHELVAPGSQ